MAISGETIDYGPCAFMDHYDPATVFSSIDTRGRYAYANQPRIAQWNLARLAETLLPLIDADENRAIARATEVINAFPEQYERHWLQGHAREARTGQRGRGRSQSRHRVSHRDGGQESRLHVGFPLPRRCGLRSRKNRFARCLPIRRPTISGVDTGGRGLRARRWRPRCVRRRCGVSIPRSFRAIIESRKP